MIKQSIVAFLARESGLNVLEELIGSNLFDIKLVLTHQYEANLRLTQEQRTHGQKPERPEYSRFCEIGKTYGIPVESKRKSEFAEFVKNRFQGKPPNFILSVNYWFMIPDEIIRMATTAALNIHPSVSKDREIVYKGLSPIDRALADKQTEVGLSIHRLTRDCDFGEVLGERRVRVDPTKDSVRDVYQKLIPCYRELALTTLKGLTLGGAHA